MNDDIIKQLKAIKSDLPKPTALFNESEKDLFIVKHGYSLVRDITKAKKELPLKRIPHIFSSIDSQIVVDILANDWKQALARNKK